MDDNNKNLLLATGLSFLVIFVWFILFPPEQVEVQPETAETTFTQVEGSASVPQADGTFVAAAPAQAATPEETRENAPLIEDIPSQPDADRTVATHVSGQSQQDSRTKEDANV